jgi:hypothetical protein
VACADFAFRNAALAWYVKIRPASLPSAASQRDRQCRSSRFGTAVGFFQFVGYTSASQNANCGDEVSSPQGSRGQPHGKPVNVIHP